MWEPWGSSPTGSVLLSFGGLPSLEALPRSLPPDLCPVSPNDHRLFVIELSLSSRLVAVWRWGSLKVTGRNTESEVRRPGS